MKSGTESHSWRSSKPRRLAHINYVTLATERIQVAVNRNEV